MGFGYLCDLAEVNLAQFIFDADPDAAPPQEARPRIATLAELRERPELLKRPPPVSKWLAWRGELSLLVGREKLGKSTFAANDAVEAERSGRKALWISFEEGLNRIVSRFVELGAAGETIHIPALSDGGAGS